MQKPRHQASRFLRCQPHVKHQPGLMRQRVMAQFLSTASRSQHSYKDVATTEKSPGCCWMPPKVRMLLTYTWLTINAVLSHPAQQLRAQEIAALPAVGNPCVETHTHGATGCFRSNGSLCTASVPGNNIIGGRIHSSTWPRKRSAPGCGPK